MHSEPPMNKRLPVAEKRDLKVGYMKLTDSAPLVLASENGLFARYGLEVTLVREVSWANLRDRLVVGNLDAAQLLAPLPMMTSYGVGGMRANLMTGLVLSLNGNAVTLSGELCQQLGMNGLDAPLDPLTICRRLRDRVVRQDHVPALTFATVHLFSMHTLQLRLWLKAGGIDPDRDVRIIVLPPAQMCDSLARGIIDGFCVGEPWNSMAVQQGTGSIASTGYQIWNNAAEKVLGVTEQWHQQYPSAHLRLRLALMEACRELADVETRVRMIETLGRPDYLDLPAQVLTPSLSGMMQFAKQQKPFAMRDMHVFWRYQACFPWRSSAALMLALSDFALARPVAGDQARALVQQCYRTDLYREAARWLEVSAPGRDEKDEGRHDGPWLLDGSIDMGADRIMLPDPGADV